MNVGHNFWIEVEGDVALSLWCIGLLEAVEETGSISAAASKVGVHFRVAWRKIKEIEQRLNVRLVLGRAGGSHGGGAELTGEAREYIRRFHKFTEGLKERAEKQFREAFGDLCSSTHSVMPISRNNSQNMQSQRSEFVGIRMGRGDSFVVLRDPALHSADHSGPRGEATISRRILRVDAAGTRWVEDSLAVEEPLEIRLGFGPPASRQHQSISLTMRTPGNDTELAAGFLLTEEIVESRDQISELYGCGPVIAPGNHQNVVRVELRPETTVDLGRLQRHFYTTSSCGVCGKTSLEALAVAVDQPAMVPDFEVGGELLVTLPEALRAAQAVFGRTGGLHAAALFDLDGRLLCVREDVGRHNALDKLIGVQLLEGRLPLGQRILLLSGRASFELLQKAFVAGVPLVAAVGAPSSLAVELAERFGITLVGWLRGGRFSIYSHPPRVRLPAEGLVRSTMANSEPAGIDQAP